MVPIEVTIDYQESVNDDNGDMSCETDKVQNFPALVELRKLIDAVRAE